MREMVDILLCFHEQKMSFILFTLLPYCTQVLIILEMVQFGGIRQVYLKFLLWSSSVASLQAPQIFQKVYYTWSVMSN